MAFWQPHLGSCSLTDRTRRADVDINRTERLLKVARRDKTAKGSTDCVQYPQLPG